MAGEERIFPSRVKNYNIDFIRPSGESRSGSGSDHKHEKRIEAGIIILSNDLKRMLLVRGRISRKYGPPKGGKIEGEHLMTTALRECKEETGYEFTEDDLLNHKSGNKFYIMISKILFYVVVLKHEDNYFIFNTQDKGEIMSVEWHSLVDIRNEINNIGKYNSPMRHMFTNDPRNGKIKLNMIMESIMSF